MTAVSPAPNFFYKSGDQEFGPISPDELREKALAREIGPDTGGATVSYPATTFSAAT
jgi:hypothetical protein